MKLTNLCLLLALFWSASAQVTELVRSIRSLKKAFPNDAVLLPLGRELVLFRHDTFREVLTEDIDLNTLVYGAKDLYAVIESYEGVYNRNIFLFNAMTEKQVRLLIESMTYMQSAIPQVGEEYDYMVYVYNRIVKNYQQLLNLQPIQKSRHPSKTNFNIDFAVFDEDAIELGEVTSLRKRQIKPILGLDSLSPSAIASRLMEKYGKSVPTIKEKVLRERDQIKSFSAIHSLALSSTLTMIKIIHADQAVNLNEELSQIINDNLHEESKKILGSKASNAIMNLWLEVSNNFFTPLERTEIQNRISEEAVVTVTIERTVYNTQTKWDRIPRLKPIDRDTIKFESVKSLVDIANKLIKDYNYIADHDGDISKAFLDSYLTSRGVIPEEGKEDEFRFSSKFAWKILKYTRPYSKNSETFKIEEVENVVDKIVEKEGLKSTVYSVVRSMSPECQQDDNVDKLSNLLARSKVGVQSKPGQPNLDFLRNNKDVIKKALQTSEFKEDIATHIETARFIVSKQISTGGMTEEGAQLYELTLDIHPLNENTSKLGYNLKIKDALRRARLIRALRQRLPVRIGK